MELAPAILRSGERRNPAFAAYRASESRRVNDTPTSHFATEPAIEVYRSRGRAACDERAFMLHAVALLAAGHERPVL